MQKKIYLHLLIFCGIWSQGIIGTSTDEEIKESSNILVRQKRVINRIPGEDKVISIKKVPYVVHIKHNMRIHCVGSILSRYVVITIASCVQFEASQYRVVSASSRSCRGTIHNVIGIRNHNGNLPHRPNDGIALLTVDPPFEYRAYTSNIQLHSGPLLAGVLGTVSGWGFDCGGVHRGTDYPSDLRSIEVPIMDHRDCVNRYQPHLEISDIDICTYHPHKKCGHNDGGAPLVVDGYLAGVYLRTGVEVRGLQIPNYPDVFVMLQHSAYNQWIRTSVRNIDLQFQNHHY